MRSFRPTPPKLNVRTVAFDICAQHDLRRHAEVFGLRVATDFSEGHFQGSTARPLTITSARQTATVAFTDTGFKAAVVTAMEQAAGSAWMPEPTYVTTNVHAAFNRPFGFLAAHRLSRLVLAGGWVTDPQPYREDRSTW